MLCNVLSLFPWTLNRVYSILLERADLRNSTRGHTKMKSIYALRTLALLFICSTIRATAHIMSTSLSESDAVATKTERPPSVRTSTLNGRNPAYKFSRNESRMSRKYLEKVRSSLTRVPCLPYASNQARILANMVTPHSGGVSSTHQLNNEQFSLAHDLNHSY